MTHKDRAEIDAIVTRHDALHFETADTLVPRAPSTTRAELLRLLAEWQGLATAYRDYESLADAIVKTQSAYLKAAEAERDAAVASLRTIASAFASYQSALARTYGQVTVVHAGRTGEELSALLNACTAIPRLAQPIETAKS